VLIFFTGAVCTDSA